MAGANQTGGRAEPVGAPEFASLMEKAGPFEPAASIAIALSGGPDSLALAVLADRWLKTRDGAAGLTALTVDHGLRAESRAEAEQVARWCQGLGIAHHILTWTGPKPASGIQAAAREARYGLLGQWCDSHGAGHLLLGHHLEDQAETFMLRLARGSGVDGLAAMSPAGWLGAVRLLRPLLEVPRERLRATLRALDQPWIEDPSNQDTSYARVRMRRALVDLEREGLSAKRLAATAARMMRARRALEAATGDILKTCAEIHPTGYARFDADALLAVPEEITLRALAALVMAVSGAGYRPRLQRLEGLLGALRDRDMARGRTLSGCLIRPCPARFARGPRDFLVCREPNAVEGARGLRPGQTLSWDRRFEIRLDMLADDGDGEGGAAEVAALGRHGWREIRDAGLSGPAGAMPAACGITVPALRADGVLIAAPNLGYARPGSESRASRFHARFLPRLPAGLEPRGDPDHGI